MPVIQLVPFFMHINLKRTSKWILKFLHFFFERDTKGKNPPFCFAPFLLTKCTDNSTVVKFPIPMFSFTSSLNQWRFQQAVFNRLKPALEIFCELRFGPHEYHIMAILLNRLKLRFKRAFSFLPVNFVTTIHLFLDLQLH